MNKFRNTVSVMLAILIITSVVPSYGAKASFKDVPSNHWAFEYVEQMAKFGYIKGNEKGEYMPNGDLNFDAAINLLARLTNPTSQERAEASNRHNKLLDEFKVVNWAKEGIAVALDKEIIAESELREVYRKGLINKPISKVDTAGYLVKAIGLEEVAKNKLAFSLPYKDVLDIEVSKMKYVSVLLDIDVFTKEGDGAGRFLPKSNLTRAVMAKMMSVSYDYIEKNPNTPVEPPKPEPPKEPEAEKLSGIFVKLTDVGNHKFIRIDNGRGEEKAYEIIKDTIISIDGKTGSHLDLVEGQRLEISIKKGSNELISVKGETVEYTISGKVKTVNSYSNKMTVEYLEDRKTISKEFGVDTRARIYLDGKSANLKDIKDGDLVELKLKNNIINDLEAKSKVQNIVGYIKEISPIKDSRDGEYNVLLVDSKDNSYKFILDSKSIVYRQNRRAKIEDLKLKDEAKVKLEYNLEKDLYYAYDVDAYVVKKNIKGIIVEMQTRYQEATKLTIWNQESKKEETYVLGKDVYIRIDKVVANSYDLKIGYYLEIVTEGDEITEIEAESTGMQSTMLGRILNVNSRTGRIELEVQNFAIDNSILGKEITIYASNASIMDGNGSKIPFEYLRRDNTINVIGNYDGSTFIAKTIIVLK